MVSRFTYAQWVWGMNTKEELIASCHDLSQAGYENFELVKTMADTFLHEYPDFAAILAEYNMHVASFYYFMGGDTTSETKDLEGKIDFIARTGAKNITMQGVWDGTPANEAELVQHTNTICAFADLASSYGIKVTFHPHHHTKLMRESDIDFVLKNTDPQKVGLCPDTAHFAACKMDPVKMVEKYKNRIYFTHFKDLFNAPFYLTDAYYMEEMQYGEFRELGEGGIDFPAIFNILKSVHYDGYLCAELDGTRTTHRESAEMTLRYLKKYW